MKLLVIAMLIAACTTTPQQRVYPLQVRQTLLHGSDVAILAGCQRGAIRWHFLLTGDYPPLSDVVILCEGVRRSFQPAMNEGLGNT